MAADSNHDINLRIRARDYSRKTFTELVAAIDDLIDAQGRQQQAAERGETSARELEKSYGDLERATRAVLRQIADVSAYQVQRQALDRASESSEQARQAHTAYGQSLEALAQPTKAQERELKALNRERARAEKIEDRAAQRLAALASRVESYGLELEGLDPALAQMTDLIGQANRSLERQEQAVGVNEAALERLAQAQREVEQAALDVALTRQRQALNQSANAALAAANGWRTAAVGSRDLAQSTTPLSDALNRIINPGQGAVRTLAELSRQSEETSLAIDNLQDPVSDLRDRTRELQQVQQGLAATSGLIDTFARQGEALRASREDYRQARERLVELAETLREASGDTRTLERDTQAAGQRLERATTAYRQNADAMRQTQAALRDAGVDTRYLTEAESELVTIAERATRAQGRLTENVDRLAEAARQSGLNRLADETLDFAQAARQAARSAQEIDQSAEGAAARLNAIVAPGQGAVRTLSELQDQSRQVAQAVGQINDPVADLRDRTREIQRLQNEVVATGRLIDAFNQQGERVNQSRERYAADQRALRDLAEQLRAATGDTRELERESRRAQAQAMTSATAYRQEADAMGQTQRALRAMGVDTRHLADAQESLTRIGRETVQSQTDLARSVAQFEQTARQGALDQRADQALRAARAMEQAAVGSRALRQESAPLSSALRAILNPGESATRTLGGLEAQAEALSQSFRELAGPVTDLRQRTQQLQQVQQRLGQTADLVDAFNRQRQAVRESRNEYVSARARLREMAEALRHASGDTRDLERELAQGQRRLASSAQGYRQQAEALRQTQGALRAAGVDTRNLSDAEGRLTAIAGQTSRAHADLQAAVERFGQASQTAGGSLNFLEDRGRRALSVIQRIRGELLALATTYVGFYGALTLAGDAIESVRIKQQALAAISVAVGEDVDRQAQQWDRLNEVLDHYGFAIEQVAQQYGKFAASAVKGGQSIATANFMFEQTLKIARAYRLNSDELSRALKALEQMVGKNQIMAEEFKGQWAEVIPGAFETGAEKLKMSVPEFTKAMERGELDATALITILRGMGKDVQGAVDQAVKGIVAAEGRLANARFRFNEQVAQSGFIDQYATLLDKLTALLESDKGAELADTVGRAFTNVALAAEVLIDKIELLEEVLILVGLYKAAQLAFSFGATLRQLGGILSHLSGLLGVASASLNTLAASLGRASVAARLTAGALSLLGRVLPFVGWALIVTEFIRLIYYSSDTVKSVVDTMIEYARASAHYLKNLLTGNYRSFADTLKDVREQVELTKQAAADTPQGGANAPFEESPDTGVSYDLQKGQKLAFDRWLAAEQKRAANNQLNATRKQMKDDLNERLKIIDNEYAPRLAEARARAAEDGGKAELAVLKIIEQQKATERIKFASDHRGSSFESWLAGEQRKAAQAELAATKKQMKDNLAARLRIIANEYAPRLAEARARAAEDGGKAERAVLELIERQKATERQRYENEHAKKAQQAALKRANQIQDVEQRLAAVRTRLQAGSDNLDRTLPYRARENSAVEAAIHSYSRLEKAIAKLGGTEAAVFTQELVALKAQDAELTRQRYQLTEIKALQSDLNNVIAARDSRIKALQAQFQAGMIDEAAYIRSVNALYNQTRDEVQQAIEAIRAFAMAHRDAFANPEAFATLMANLDEYQAKLTATGRQLNGYLKQGLEGTAQSVGVAFDSIVSSLVDIRHGMGEWTGLFTNLSAAMGQFFAQLLRNIAMAIIQAAILKALMSFFAPQTESASTITWFNHDGGMVGSPGRGGRSVSPALFAGAQRYHTGGMVGLQPNEVPIIAQRGEEVLSRKDPRNRLNGGLGNQGASSIRVIAVDDQRQAVTEALKTPAGQKAIITSLRSNLTTVKNMIRSG